MTKIKRMARNKLFFKGKLCKYYTVTGLSVVDIRQSPQKKGTVKYIGLKLLIYLFPNPT